MRKQRWTVLAVAAVAATVAFGQTANGDHWITTWAASAQQPRVPARGPAPAQNNGAQGTPAPAPAPPAFAAPTFSNQTLRMVVHASVGGRRIRVHLSNDFGAAPLTIGAAHVALRSMDSSITPGTDHALTFNGKPTVMIPAGAQMISDAVDLNFPQLGDLAVSIFIPGETGPATMHATGLHTTYISKAGDFTGAPMIADATTSQSYYLLSAVDVLGPADAATIVAFGDSITDGAASTPNKDQSWPSQLAGRLSANPATAHIAVANEGISGNRVLRDGAGVSALARFDRDVLGLAGVKWMIVLESINDIGIGTREGAATADAVTADDLIGGLRQLVDRAHAHGIKVMGATLTPFQGAAYYSDKGEEVRSAVNQWIRTGGAFDAVVDFDAVTRDSNNPKTFRADYNLRDHLHPNDAGYKAMAEAIDLSLFGAKAPAGRSSQVR